MNALKSVARTQRFNTESCKSLTSVKLICEKLMRIAGYVSQDVLVWKNKYLVKSKFSIFL